MVLERIVQMAMIGAAIFTASYGDAAEVRYYDEGAVPDARTVARLLADRQSDPARKAGSSRLFAKDKKTDVRVHRISAVRLDATAAREKRINALAQAAVEDWRFRRTRKGRAAMIGAAYKPGPTQTSAVLTELAIGIHFADDSAQLPRSAQPGLDAIARGIRLSGFRHALLIEGHTSASGNASRDLRLSRLRAESVKRYLVSRHAIPADRVRAVGLGAQRLLNRKDPRAAENRRVQLRVLT